MIRATLKSLLARKLRLALSGLAVVLSVMFVAGSFVLTDTLGRSVDALFANVYTFTDIQVAAKPKLEGEGGASPAPVNVPASLVERVRREPDVKRATGQVFANGTRLVGKNGKVVPNPSGANFGANWPGETDLYKLSQGRGPTADNEIVINNGAAKAGGFKVSDPVGALTLEPKQTFTIVGIFTYVGGRDSLGGEFTTFFTEPVAQRLVLGEPGVYNSIDVRAADGVALPDLRDDLRATLGPDYLVQTGPELAKRDAAPAKEVFKFVNYVLLGFAGVALLVGIFLILNTFSIIVAQRTQELALLRAMGASRGQMMGSVLLEAILIGLFGSALGFAAGVGLGAGGAYLLATVFGSLEVASLGVPATAVIVAFAVGITVTVVAAVLPALRAARIPPVAAMQEAAAADRPLTRLTVIGGAITAAGGGLLGWGLSGAGKATLWLILGGVLATLVGVALLTPIISRPVVSLIGRLFSWSVPGTLGRRDSARNPRRTAITAAAMMIGIALVTAISTVFASLSATVGKLVDKELQADLVIAGQQTSEIPPTIDAAALNRVRQLSDVETVTAVSYDAARINGKNSFILAYDDLTAARRVLKMKAKSGSIESIGPGQTIVDEKTAKDAKVGVGDQVRIQLVKGDERAYTVVAVTTESNINSGFVLSWKDAEAGFRFAQPIQAYVKLRPGTSATAVQRQIDDIVADSPEVTVQKRSDYVESSNQIFDILLGVVQVLLLVAIVISVLGVINTLVLSVIERTRELGMLRAIGLRRSQTMRMITVESMVIALFGTLLGLGVGAGLGSAIVRALKLQLGFGDLALPWGLMGLYLLAAVIIGVVAAVIPAVRAARLNVLNAIAYE